MREIKFRGKRTDNGKWVYGSLLIDYATGKFFIHSLGNSVNDSDKVGEEGILNFVAFEVIPETVSQYTGLKDRNGKEIFDGDIVVAWSQGYRAVGEVKQRIDGLWIMYPAYQKGKMWGLCPNPKGDTSIEIIGNIHDNYELLENS